MFGYIVVNKPELKFREFDAYKEYYCGLCSVLSKNYGLKGQITLNYDMTFLCLLLSGLYDCNNTEIHSRCIAHPIKTHSAVINVFTEYAADMNILLTYYQCLDDWMDNHSYKKKVLSDVLKRSGEKVADKYPEQAKIIVSELKALSEYEKNDCRDIDAVAGCFGRLMASIFTFRHDEWEKYLYDVGFYLGKFIYILDAYADYEEDKREGHYNPLSEELCHEENCRKILMLMISKCCSAYEMLPIVDNDEILKNILYAGIWSGFKNKRED